MLNTEWRIGEVFGTSYSSGLVYSEIFRGFFFLHAILLLLLLDGHSSHYQPRLIEYARELCLIRFCFPPKRASIWISVNLCSNKVAAYNVSVSPILSTNSNSLGY